MSVMTLHRGFESRKMMMHLLGRQTEQKQMKIGLMILKTIDFVLQPFGASCLPGY
jgi:hypothetical protein